MNERLPSLESCFSRSTLAPRRGGGTWLGEARRRDPPPPLVFVDYWPGSFRHAPVDRKEIEMIHELRMPYKDCRPIHYGSGWNLDQRPTYAVWDKGFQAFLAAPSELEHVLGELR